MKAEIYIITLIILLFFPFQLAKSQSCEGFPVGTVQNESAISYGPECSPVTLTWTATFKRVNDGGDPTKIAFQFDWDDGSPLQLVPYDGVILTNPSANRYVATVTHVFPSDNTNCRYDVVVHLVVNGTVCDALIDETVYAWDTDNDGSGELRVVDEKLNSVVYYVCEGYADTIRFWDNSTLNCNLAESPINVNSARRWIQFQYGTYDDPLYSATPRIPNIKVNTTEITNNLGVLHSNLNSDGLTREKDGTITPYDPPLATPPSGYLTDYIYVPSNNTAGQVFEIRLRNWNFCNQYDNYAVPGPPADLKNGDRPPVTTVARIEIITSPPKIPPASNIFCLNADLSVNVPSTIPGSNIHWYATYADAISHNPALRIFNGETLDPESLPAPYTFTSSIADSINYYVTEEFGGCESKPSKVKIVVREALAVNGSISGNAVVCDNTTSLVYSVVDNPPNMPYGGTTEYVWSYSGMGFVSQGTRTITLNALDPGDYTISVFLRYTSDPRCESPVKTFNVHVNALPSLSTTPTSAVICYNVGRNLPITFTGEGTGNWTFTYKINPAGTIQTVTPTTFPYSLNIPSASLPVGNDTVYLLSISQLKTVTCAGTVSTPKVALHKNAQPAGTILTPDTTICDGVSPAIRASLSGEGGGTWSYRYRLNGTDRPYITGVTSSPNTYIFPESSLNSGNNTIILNSIRETANGITCTSTGTSTKIITNNVLPTVWITSTNFKICDGNNATVNIQVAGSGSNNFIVSYQLNSNPVQTTPEFNGSTYSIVIPAADLILGANTFSVTDITQNSGAVSRCDGSAISPFSITITNNVLPTAGTDDPDDEICQGTDFSFDVDLTGVTGGNFVLGYRINAGAIQYTSEFDDYPTYTLTIPAASLNIGVNTITLTSITQNVGVPAPCNGTIVTGQESINVTVDQPPTPANAGINLAACDPTIMLTLGANPVTTGTGQWTIVSTPVGAGATTFSNPALFNSTFSITSGSWGVYTLRWTTHNIGVCPDSTDEVELDFGASPTPANAGPDFTACFPDTILDGNTPIIGTGTWTTFSSPPGSTVTFDDIHDPESNVEVDIAGNYIFTWTITSGICTPSQDNVNVNFLAEPTVANPTPQVCSDAVEGSTATVNLTEQADDINSGAGLTFFYYSDLAHTTSIGTPTSYNVSNGTVIYVVVRNASSCESYATITYTVNPRPTAINQTPTVCSDGTEGSTAYVDLTAQSAAIDGAYSYTITYFTDATLLTPVPDVTHFQVTDGQTVYAKVVNGLCQNSATVTYTVRPRPTALDQTPAALCSDNANEYDRVVNLTSLDNAIDGTYSYSIAWFGDAALTTAIGTPANYNVTHNVPVYARVFNGSCYDTAKVTYTINPTPNVTNTDLADGVCTGNAPGFTPTGDVSGTAFNWVSALTSGSASGFTNSSGDIDDVLTNSTYLNAVVTYTITPSTLYCTGSSVDYLVTVYPKPDVSNTDLRDSICSGASVNFIPTGHVSGSAFNWVSTESSANVTDPGNSSGPINHALTNSGIAVELVTYAITPTANGCLGDPVNYLMYVKPKPTITNIDLNDSICSGATLNFHPTSSIASTDFNWTSTAINVTGNRPSWSGNITDVLSNSGLTTGQVDYTITPTFDNCPGDPEIYNVTVFKYPIILSISDNEEKCVTETANFNVSATGSSITYHWQRWNGSTFADITEALPYSGTHLNSLTVSNITTTLDGETYQVLVTNEGLCSLNSLSRTLTVNPPPVLDPLTDVIVCPGDLINPPDFATTPAGSSYSWTNTNISIGLALSDDGQIPSWTAVNTTTDSIKAVISVTPTLGTCPGSADSFRIIIKPRPTLGPVFSKTVCPGDSIKIPAFTANLAGSGFEWVNTGDTRCGIISGTGNIAPYLAPANNSAGDYTGIISVRALLNGCYSSISNFNINLKPTPGTTAINGLVNVCASTATSSTTQVYRVDGAGGSPSSTYTWNILTSTPAIAAPDVTPFHNSLLIDYSDQSWTGTIQVIEKSGDGCFGSPRTATLHSYEIPIINAGPDTSVCSGGHVPLGGSPTASGGSSSFTYRWTPATGLDDATSSNPVATLTTPTSYTLTLTDAISGCVASPDYVNVAINPKPAAPVSTSESICFGDAVPDLAAVGTDIRWYGDISLTNFLGTSNPFPTGATLAGADTFYVTQTIAGCESSPRMVTLTINTVPAKPYVSDVTICYGQAVPDLIFAGSGVRWYDNLSPAHLVKNGSVFTTSKVDPGIYTYYVTQTENNCESPADTVVLTIKPRPAAPLADNQLVCANDAIPSLFATGTDVEWYNDSFLSSLVNSGNSFSTGLTAPGTYTFYATQTVDGCMSTAKSVNLVIRPVPEIIAAFATDETVCNSGDGKATIIATGTPPLQYSVNGGTTFAASGNFTSLVNGNYPTAVRNSYGCIFLGDTLVISSGSAPVKPVAGTSAIYCQGQTLTDLFATPLSGGVIKWYKDAGLTTSVSSALTLTPDNVIGTTYYYVTETYGGCESPSVNISVTINATPSTPVINDTTICTGLGVPILYAEGENIYWYSDATLSTVVNFGNIFRTGAVTAGTYTWYLASTVTGCRGPVNDVTLTIQNTPPTPVGIGTTSCEGATLPALTATGSNIIWYSNSILTNRAGTGNSLNTGNTLSGKYYYYIVDTVGICRSEASVVLQNINKTPDKPEGYDAAICQDEGTPALSATGFTIKWYSDALLTTQIGDRSVLYLTDYLPGTYSYYATQTINSCQSAPDTVSLVIKPKPLAPVATNEISCEGDPTPTLTATGSNLRWYYLIKQVGSGPSFNTGKTTPDSWEYSVTQTVDGCESDAKEVTLTINPAPVFISSSFTDQTACNSNDGTITINAETPVQYSISDGFSYQPGKFFNSLKNGLYPIRLINSFGCTTAGDTIAIHDGGAPPAPSAIKDTGYCANQTFEPLQATAGVAGTLTWYSDWGLTTTLGTGNSITPSMIIGSTHYYVTETSGDCESDPTVLTVSVNLVPFPPVSRDTALCYGLPVPNLTAQGNGIEWFNSSALDNRIGQGPSFKTGKRDTGTYVYYVTQIIDGCRSQATIDSLVIHPRAVAEFEPSTDQGCSPLDVNFNNTSTGTIFTWTFGDQTTDNSYSPNHQYINNTYSLKNYPVKLIANNRFNCSNSLVKFVTVFPFPNYQFSTMPDEGCNPVNVNFLTASGAQNYDWNFGDYTTSNGINHNPNHLYENDTYDYDSIYYVSLVATSAYGCVGTYYDTVIVHPNPDVSFTTDMQASCSPYTPILDNLSEGATKYRWNFGDNTDESTEREPIHTFTNTSTFPQTYTITLRGENNFGCFRTATQNIRVQTPLNATFSLNTTGCSPFSTTTNNKSIGSGLSFYWTTSDRQESGAMNPTFTFNNLGFSDSIYTVQLVAQSQHNCFDTAVEQVVVYARPRASFQVDPSELLYPETTVSIIQNTEDSPSGIWQYQWSFGDDSASKVRDPQQHVYDTSGVYIVKLRVDGIFCFDTTSRVVTILLPPPIAGFDSVPPDCSPYTVKFNNTTIYAERYRWSFGDGSFSNKKNPDHEFWDPGVYVVTLSVEGPAGTDSYSRIITAHPTPKARFEVAPAFVYVPNQPVKCFNQSEDGDLYEWYFGDNTPVNTDTLPIHYYQEAGTFDISMVVRTNTEPQCSDSITVEKAVIAEVAGNIKLPNAFRPTEGGSNGGHYTPGGYNNHIFYPPVSESVTEFKLMIFNRWGQKMFETKDITQGWDGYFNGKLCEQGVYVWRVEGRYANKQTFVKMGDVTLVR